MNNFEISLPTRIVFGKDTHKQAGALLRDYGFQKVLLYYGGGSIKKTGVYDAVTASLKEAGVAYVEKGGVCPNPTVGFCRETAAFTKAEQVDCILVVGGGSAIDSAKMAALSVGSDADPWDIMLRKAPAKKALPIAVVLTISAAGSETSEHAVLTEEVQKSKRGFASQLIRPLFAIMDPTLTYTLPPYQTAAGIVDIMMHTLERYFCHNGDNALTDRLCEGLVRSVIEAGPRAIKDPEDYEARATLMWAGSLSHNGLMGTGREHRNMDAHAIEHELSAYDPNVTHGAGLAVVWPAYLKFIAPHCMERMLQYASRIWNIEIDHEHPERTVEAGIKATEQFFASIGMPATLRELGIGEDAIEELAVRATFFGERIINSYVPLTKEAYMEIYRLCL